MDLPSLEGIGQGRVMAFYAMVATLCAKVVGSKVQTFIREKNYLIFDFAYADLSGHHHSLNQLFTKAMGGEAAVGILANRALELPASRSVYPYFTRTVYGKISTLPGWQRRKKKVERSLSAQLLWLGLRRWQGKGILVHTLSAFHLHGLIKHWAIHQVSVPLVVYLMLPPDFHVDPSLSGHQEDLYREAFALAAQSRNKPIFLCENPLLADQFGRLGPLINICQLPLPAYFPDDVCRAPSAASWPVMLYIGDVRNEKGVELLAECLARRGVRQLPINFRLMITSAPEHWRQTLSSLTGDNVEVVFEDYLSIEAYFAVISVADLMLLPYHPESYRTKNSNVVSEALGMGVPVLVPGGVNSLRSFVEHHAPGAGVVMEAYSADALEQALQTSLRKLSSLKAAAAEAKKEIRTRRSLESFSNAMAGFTSRAP